MFKLMGGEVGDRRFGCSKSTSTISTSTISTQQFANSTKKGAKLFWIIESNSVQQVAFSSLFYRLLSEAFGYQAGFWLRFGYDNPFGPSIGNIEKG